MAENSSSFLSSLKPEYVLLAVGCVLAPVIGGQVSTDTRPLFDSVLVEVLGGGGLPLMARLLLSLFFFGALALALRRRVVQVPHVRILTVFGVFLGVIAASVLLSRFKYVSAKEWCTWMVFAAAFFGVVACGGRLGRLRGLAGALGAGISVVALKGIGEYASLMKDEPTHRIFADYVNPNAVATVLVMGVMVLLGLGVSEAGWKRNVSWVGSAVCSAALVLTQSKAGYLAFGVGTVALLVSLGVFRQVRGGLLGVAGVVVGAVLGVGLTQLGSSLAKTGPGLARIAEAGAQAEQSVGFRQNLWRSAVEIIQAHPGGTGVGTFRMYSTQPGLTDQTVFAHQAYLQLASEASVAALGLIVIVAILWLVTLFKGSKQQPVEILGLKAGVFAAIVAFGAHSLVESNFSYLANGLVFFVLLAIGLQLSTDGSSPEAMPSTVRGVLTFALCLLPLGGCLMTAMTELRKANLQTALTSGDAEVVTVMAKQLSASAWGDPEALYLSAFDPSLSPTERMKILDSVAEMHPSPKYLRAAANQAQSMGETGRALEYLAEVDKWDPSNLPGRLMRLKILVADGQKEEAIKEGQALYALEGSPSFTIRAIPEIVPTETYEARLILSTLVKGSDEQDKLMLDALGGYVQYHDVTLRKLLDIKAKMEEESGQSVDDALVSFGSENLKEAREKLSMARGAGEEFVSRLREQGKDSSEAEKMLKSLTDD